MKATGPGAAELLGPWEWGQETIFFSSFISSHFAVMPGIQM